MKLRNTWLRSAMARILASASTSVTGAGRASASPERIEPGTMASVIASSDGWPTTRSMCAISASLGPMWRETKASWCSSERREAGWDMARDSGGRGWAACVHAGRPSVLLPESSGPGASLAPCTFGAGFDRSLQSCPRRRYVGLSDYGRCAFGSRPADRSASPAGGSSGRDYSPCPPPPAARAPAWDAPGRRAGMRPPAASRYPVRPRPSHRRPARRRTPMPPQLPKSTGRLALLLAGLSMFGPFSIAAIFPAFPAMGAALGADKLAMQQTISAYLVAYAVMSLVHGPLSDALGRRRVILGGLLVFMLASVGCALANDLTTMLLFRALQGLSAGVGLIVGRAVIRDVLQGDDAQRLMSQVSMIFGIAPAIAPVIGGWILGWGHWHDIFWFLVAFAALLAVASWAWLPETHPPEQRGPLAPRRMLRDYVLILANGRFQRLAAAGALNFAALFLYIASAPAFVLDLLRLDERSFAWFFGPMI